MKTRIAFLTILALPLAGLTAQSPVSRFSYEIQLDGSELYANPVIGAVSSSLSGTLFGGEGRIAFGPVGVDLGYWQGTLNTQSGPQPTESVVEGKALLGISPVSWFRISAGPFARAYTTNAGTERWLSWRVQGRVEQPLVPQVVRGYAELWFVASSTVNVVQPFTSGRGGRLGLRVAPASWPVWFTLGYGIEQTRLGSGSRIDTVDRITLGVGYGKR